MKPEHHHLLHDLLASGDRAAQRDAVLNATYPVLRRKRHMRYLTRTLPVAAFAGLAALAITKMGAPGSRSSGARSKLAATPSPPAVSHVQVITDDELLALFPGTPVGLAKVNG